MNSASASGRCSILRKKGVTKNLNSYLRLSELGQHILAGALDAARRVARRNVCKRGEWEIRLQLAAQLEDEGLPHQSARRVVGEGEVKVLVEELLELLLVAFVGLRCARHDRDARLVGDPLGAPLAKRLLNTVGVGHVVLLGLLLTLLLFLFGGPDLFCFIDVDQRWLVLFGTDHYHGNHLLGVCFAGVELTVNIAR